MEQTTVSSRIPKSLSESLENASKSRGVFQSEIIRRALRYYIEQNPDDIEALNVSKLENEDSVEGFSDLGTTVISTSSTVSHDDKA